MATEHTFRSPGFSDREIDRSTREIQISGVPAGIVATSQMGPAFVPVTVGTYTDFVNRFGEPDRLDNQFGPYAVRQFLKNRSAVTFIRVLGAGANTTTTDFSNTRIYGTVKNAGFTVIGDGLQRGEVKFLVARHYVSASTEAIGYPIFSDNNTYDVASTNQVNLVRGMIFMASGTRLAIFDHDQNPETFPNATNPWSGRPVGTDLNEVANVGGVVGNIMKDRFKLVVSSSSPAYGVDSSGVANAMQIHTVSLNPNDDAYISKVLNTDPLQFQKFEHLLYGDFAVENELAPVDIKDGSVGIASGSTASSQVSSVRFRDLYGRFDTRYSNAKTTKFISQPFGAVEYDLFHIETIGDGAKMGQKFKISITNLKKSSDENDRYGSFSLQVRDFYDTDISPDILESYDDCSLDPNSDRYIVKKIGDFKFTYNFDAESEEERRMTSTGRYPNLSSRIRIIPTKEVVNKEIPLDALPFGFKGIPQIKTNEQETQGLLKTSAPPQRLTMSGSGTKIIGPRRGDTTLSASFMPPVPMTFKQTTNKIDTSAGLPTGYPGANEQAQANIYWGVKTTRIPKESTLPDAIFQTNQSSDPNPLVESYTKLLGIQGLDALTTGSASDKVNNNKFTLAKVAFLNNMGSSTNLASVIVSAFTASAKDHMREAAYVRNGVVDSDRYTINDGTRSNRLTFASLASLTSSVYFNRFSEYTKFTNIMFGGFDGLNILDPDMSRMNDRGASQDLGGKARGDLNIGLRKYTGADTTSLPYDPGTGKYNNIVASYKAGTKVLTDPMQSRINILTIPGQRDSFVTDYALERAREYTMAIYLLDIPSYTADGVRMFDDDGRKPGVNYTIQEFGGRAIDNNYAATYFPDVFIKDNPGDPLTTSTQVPASIAALTALGYNDRVAGPWFAPAGFNRSALDDFTDVVMGAKSPDRDSLYEAKINPIAKLANSSAYVIFGQKTLQQARTSLDRVNVRRMLLEVKRLVSDVATGFVFEQNTPGKRAQFVSQVSPLLANIQSAQGIDEFRVVMDETNNTVEDVESNRLNGRIVIVPTRAVEFIAIDFIIANSGVEFA